MQPKGHKEKKVEKCKRLRKCWDNVSNQRAIEAQEELMRV